MTHFRFSLLTLAALGAGTLWAQTPSSVEAAEYEPNSDRWLVSNGSSILVTADEGASWSTFGSGGANYGMEVLGSTLFAIQSNVIRAYDVVTGEELGSVAPAGVGFLNGMGSESTAEGDVLVVSDFSAGRLLKVDVSDPTNMVATTLVSNTGTTPNGVTIQDGVATVVNWYGNADILQVDLATGALTTLIDGTGLGNCDGVVESSAHHAVLSRPRHARRVDGRDRSTGQPPQQPCRLERQHSWRPVCRGLQRQQHGLLWRTRISFKPSPHRTSQGRRLPSSRGRRA